MVSATQLLAAKLVVYSIWYRAPTVPSIDNPANRFNPTVGAIAVCWTVTVAVALASEEKEFWINAQYDVFVLSGGVMNVDPVAPTIG